MSPAITVSLVATVTDVPACGLARTHAAAAGDIVAGTTTVAASHGAQTLELNLEPSEGSRFFGEVRTGPAAQLVPEWVGELEQARTAREP